MRLFTIGPLMKWLISRRTRSIPDNADFQVWSRYYFSTLYITYFLINNYNNTTTLDNEIKITPSLSKSLLIVINVYVICCVYKALDTCCLRTECCLLSDCPGSPHPRWLLITSTVFGVTLNSQTVARSAVPGSLLCTATTRRAALKLQCGSCSPLLYRGEMQAVQWRVTTRQRQQKTTNPC